MPFPIHAWRCRRCQHPNGAGEQRCGYCRHRCDCTEENPCDPEAEDRKRLLSLRSAFELPAFAALLGPYIAFGWPWLRARLPMALLVVVSVLWIAAAVVAVVLVSAWLRGEKPGQPAADMPDFAADRDAVRDWVDGACAALVRQGAAAAYRLQDDGAGFVLSIDGDTGGGFHLQGDGKVHWYVERRHRESGRVETLASEQRPVAWFDEFQAMYRTFLKEFHQHGKHRARRRPHKRRNRSGK